ncbi:MAG: TAXI family TRAP transporter solute-binding subunit [Phaeospirillum sp.]|nr:TAXI family TRAP transporter solute-binding subunit [Phaeospirillum sp.]
MRNRTRILLLGLVTVVLTVVATVTARDWYRQPAVITIAVGPETSPENRFAVKLAEVLQQNHASIRLKVETQESRSQALSRFAHHEADLAIVRTDDRKIPANARALAVLEHEALLLFGVKRAKFGTLADIQGKRVVVVGRDGRNEAFVRRLLEQYKFDPHKTDIRTVPPETSLDKMLSASADLAILVYPLSRLGSGRDFRGLAHHERGVSVHAINDARALERKVPGVYTETIEAGLLSGSPRMPEEDIETVALQKILVARRGMPEQHAVELMRALFEYGRQLAIDGSFATRIEPPDPEKGAQIAIHEGANQYIASEVKTFFDRYSDLIYIGISMASVLASMAVALYSTVFRHSPHQANERIGDLIRLRDRIRSATLPEELTAAEAELEAVLNETLLGLADGALSPRGLEAFRLAYDLARDDLIAAHGRIGG